MVMENVLVGDPADGPCERLQHALGVCLRPAPLPEAARAVPVLPPVEAIDRTLGFDRLGAARQADAALASATDEARKRPGNPGVGERFVAVLGAWASTREALGLKQPARRALEQALAWAGRDPASSLYAFTVERAAHILAETGAVSWLEQALAVHLTTKGSGPAVTSCLMRLADALAQQGDQRRARFALETALALSRDDPTQRAFEIEQRLALLHLKAERLETAAALLEALDHSAFSLPSQKNLLAARAALAEAQGHLPTAIRFQIAAVELASEVCGPEIVLEDLLAAVRLRRALSTDFDAEDEGRLITAARTLLQVGNNNTDDDLAWPQAVRRLGRALITGKSPKGAEPETLRADLLSLQQQALDADLPETANVLPLV